MGARTGPKPIPAEARFWPKVNKRGPFPIDRSLGRCWCWLGALRPDGRGQFYFDGRARMAHIAAYIMVFGPLPADKPCVTHLCDGGAIGCVRPSHLVADTSAGNVAQAVARRRMAAGERHGSRHFPESVPSGEIHWTRRHPENIVRGEDNGQSALTASDVRSIRARTAEGVPRATLAAEYHVTPSNIGCIVRRVSWKHVP